MRTDVGLHRITRIALDLYDMAHVLGSVVRFKAWRRAFHRGKTKDTVARAWTRTKGDLVDMGVLFSLRDTGDAKLSLEFESSDYMYQQVRRLIGDPEHYVPANKRGGPALTEAEIRAAIAELRSERSGSAG